jgi:hypothetical protein
MSAACDTSICVRPRWSAISKSTGRLHGVARTPDHPPLPLYARGYTVSA